MKGYLEVGLTEDETEVIINHPDLEPDKNGCGHIVFSPAEALHLANLLIAKSFICIERRGRPPAIDADGTPQPRSPEVPATSRRPRQSAKRSAKPEAPNRRTPIRRNPRRS